MSFLYNPDRMTEQEVRDTFVARTSLVDTMLELIERQPSGAGVQHAIITGPRGMGKTTMLLMVQLRINESELSKKWQPVKFPEESYSINDLADLWLETLHLLAASTNDGALESEIGSLRDKQLSVNDLQEHAWAMIKDWCASRKKRLVLLIDNFDMIIEQIGDDREQSRLRDILMNGGTVMVIGTAVSFFKEAHYDKPFYHFFRLFDLRGLTHDDVVTLLKRRAVLDNNADFETKLVADRGRFLALEYFTGGNPRLILMLYRVVMEWGSTEVRKALEKLLDEVTPYYKARTETLPGQQRKILDHIARESAKSFEGLSPSDIASATRMKVNQVSMQLKRLAEAGYVRSANIKGRSSCFTLSEPLYAIWYQMRFSRTAKERMLWLVNFLKIWFEMPQLLEEAKAVMGKVGGLCRANERLKALCVLEHGKYLLEAMPEGPEKFEVANEYLRSQIMAEDWEGVRETAEVADLTKLTNGELTLLHNNMGVENCKYLNEKARREFIQNRFEEALKILDVLVRMNSNFYQAWNNRGIVLKKIGRFEEAIKSFDESLNVNPDRDEAWSNRGNTLIKLQRFDEAIESFDKALQINPTMHELWYFRGHLLQKLERFEAAVDSYNNVLKLKPDDVGALVGKGIALSDIKKFEAAIKVYDEALKLKPDDGQIWFLRGIAYWQLEHYKSAIESFDVTIQKKPDHISALLCKGKILSDLGEHADAFHSFDQATKNTSDILAWTNRTEVSLILVQNALSQNNPTQALHYLEEARKSELIIGSEKWMSLVLNTILLNIPNLPTLRTLLTQANLNQQLFPLIRAIDYLESGNEELIEKLSPEYRKIVMDVAKSLKNRQIEMKTGK